MPFTTRNVFAAASHDSIVFCECLESDEIKELSRYKLQDDSIYSICWGFIETEHKYILAAAGEMGVIRVIDVEGQEEWGQAKGHTNYINDMKRHPQIHHIFGTASADQSVRLWNLKSLVCVAAFYGDYHRNQVASVEFDSSGKFLLSGGMDKNIVVWSLEPAEELIRKSDEELPIKTVRILQVEAVSSMMCKEFVDSMIRFGPSCFICRSQKSEIFMFQLVNENNNHIKIRKLHNFLKGDPNNVWFIRMELDRQGKYLAVGDVKGNIMMWDLAVDDTSDIKFSVITTENRAVARMITFSHDGSIIIVGSDDGSVLRYDRKKMRIKEEIDLPSSDEELKEEDCALM